MPANPNPKLSKLQKFILTEAFKTWSKSEQNAEAANLIIARFKPGAVPIQPEALAHVSRNHILRTFFGLSLRKWRWQGVVDHDQVTNRIDREAAEQEVFNRANASLYRAFARLERRGLIKRMTKRADWQLTQAGLEAASGLEQKRATSPRPLGPGFEQHRREPPVGQPN
jgi:hypothetical protein